MLIAQDAAAVGANATFQQVHTSTALIAISCDLRASKEFELCHHLRLESGLLHHRPRSRQSSVRRLPCGIAIPRSSRGPPCRIGHVSCWTTGVWPALLITPVTGNRSMCQRWLGADWPAAKRGRVVTSPMSRWCRPAWASRRQFRGDRLGAPISITGRPRCRASSEPRDGRDQGELCLSRRSDWLHPTWYRASKKGREPRGEVKAYCRLTRAAAFSTLRCCDAAMLRCCDAAMLRCCAQNCGSPTRSLWQRKIFSNRPLSAYFWRNW